MHRIMRAFEFEAAHFLPEHRGKCSEMHGHSYKVEVFILAHSVDAQGMVFDFGILKELWNIHIDPLVDHGVLNESLLFKGVYPTAENMARVFFDEISRLLSESPVRKDIWVEKVRVYEKIGFAWAEYERGK